MTGRGQFFAPGSACDIRLAIRADPAQRWRALDVELFLDGHLANRVRADADSWKEVRIVLRPDAASAFRRIELRTPAAPTASLLTTVPRFLYCGAAF